jgi:peptidoglycan/LPS O-acetylase OafA/YrhL
VSQYFADATTGETLWNPATRVAQLFVGMTEALVPVAGLPCGVGDSQSDEYAVAPDTFAAFVDALVTQYLSSNHPIFKAMLAGYLSSAVVMVQRSGRSLAALAAPIPRSTEVISTDADASGPDTERTDLIVRAAESARSMPAG